VLTHAVAINRSRPKGRLRILSFALTASLLTAPLPVMAQSAAQTSAHPPDQPLAQSAVSSPVVLPAPTEVHKLFPDCTHPVDPVDPAICYGQPSRDAYRTVALTYIALMRGMLLADREKLQIDQANWIGRMNRECTGPAYEKSDKLPSLAELSLVLQAECVKRESDARVASMRQVWAPRSTARLAPLPPEGGVQKSDVKTPTLEKPELPKPGGSLALMPAGDAPKSDVPDLLSELLKGQAAGTVAEGKNKEGDLQSLLAPFLPKLPGMPAADANKSAGMQEAPLDLPADPDFANRADVLKAMQGTESKLTSGREWARGQQGTGLELLGPANAALSQCRRARQQLALLPQSRYAAGAGRAAWQHCQSADAGWQRQLRVIEAANP
jgi:hypothetical protein